MQVHAFDAFMHAFLAMQHRVHEWHNMEMDIMYMGTEPWHKAVQIIERKRIVPGPVAKCLQFYAADASSPHSQMLT